MFYSSKFYKILLPYLNLRSCWSCMKKYSMKHAAVATGLRASHDLMPTLLRQAETSAGNKRNMTKIIALN